jgi:hypothetical protein
MVRIGEVKIFMFVLSVYKSASKLLWCLIMNGVKSPSPSSAMKRGWLLEAELVFRKSDASRTAMLQGEAQYMRSTFKTSL